MYNLSTDFLHFVFLHSIWKICEWLKYTRLPSFEQYCIFYILKYNGFEI